MIPAEYIDKIESLVESKFDHTNPDSLQELICVLFEKYKQKESEVTKVKEEVQALNEVVTNITTFDFTQKAEQDGSGSVIDLLGLTINMLSEEMEAFTLSMEYVNNILYSIPDLVLVLDKDFKITKVNRAVQDFNYFESDILFKSLDEFFDRRKFTFSKFKDKVRQESVLGKEYVFIGGNKEEVPVLVSCSMIKNEENKGEGYVVVIRDISVSKRREKELRKAKEEAEQAAEAKARFLSTMSHEIRTPMNAVNGLTHILLDGNPRIDQLENLKTLKYSADSLMVLINDVLDMNKIESGKVLFEKDHFRLYEVLQNIEKTFEPKLKTKGLSFNTNLKDIPEYLIGDKVRLNQVFSNIIGNAVKFTHDGGVTVNASVLKQDEDKVKLKFEIVDTGIGIADSKIESIFDDFTQIDNSNTRKYGGTGLGLSICKKLIHLQGGNISVQSSVGRGSTFTIYLTYGHSQGVDENNATPAVVKKVPKDRFKGFKGAKVLLVEDNPVNVIVTNQFLKIWDFKVEVAKNGAEAISRVSDTNFDIILMDLQMPIMDGFEATKNIRKMSDSVKSGVPIIALTASAMIEDRKHVLNVGMNDHVSKPFNPDELFNKMRKLIGHQVA